MSIVHAIFLSHCVDPSKLRSETCLGGGDVWGHTSYRGHVWGDVKRRQARSCVRRGRTVSEQTGAHKAV